MQEIKDILHTAKRFLEGELLLTLKEETVGKTASGVPFLGFLLKPQGIYLSQKKKKRLKKRIKEYRYKLESGEWDEAEYALHITPVLAHVAISRGRRYCNRILWLKNSKILHFFSHFCIRALLAENFQQISQLDTCPL